MAKDTFVFAKIVVIRFPGHQSEKPILSNAMRQFDLEFNILSANVIQGKDGMMVLELRGHRKNVEDALKFLRDNELQIKTMGQLVRRNEDVCYHCGACTAVCPTGALSIVRPEMRVDFNEDRCMSCEVCVTACPPRAMEAGLITSRKSK